MTLEGRSLSLASYRGGTERLGNVLRVSQPGGGRTHTQETLALRVGVWSLDSVQCGPSGGLRPRGHTNGRLFLLQVRYTSGGGSPSTSLRTCPGEELEQAGTLVLRTASRAP